MIQSVKEDLFRYFEKDCSKWLIRLSYLYKPHIEI